MLENLIFKLMRMYLHGNHFQRRGKEKQMTKYIAVRYRIAKETEEKNKNIANMC